MKMLNEMPEESDTAPALTNREESALNYAVELVFDLATLDSDLMAIALVVKLDLGQVVNVKRAYLQLFNETI